MQVAEYNRIDDLRVLSEKWNEILQASGDKTVFSTWEWISRWWEHLGSGKELRVLVASQGSQIVGIAPLMLCKYSIAGLSMNRLEFIAGPQSDYNSFILLKNEEECLAALFDHMMKDPNWHSMKLADVPEGLTLAALRKTRESWNLDVQNGSPCQYMELPVSTDDFVRHLKKDLRHNIRRRERKIREQHKIGVKKYADFRSIEEAMEVFFDLHQMRWTSKGKPGDFVLSSVRDFHVAAATDFAKKGWLSLLFLTVDEEPAAALYCFDYGKRRYVYQSGFDPRYETYGVGTLVEMQSILESIQKGLREFDLMKGRERYKSYWPTKLRSNFDVHLVRKGCLAKAYRHAMRNDAMLALVRRLVRT